MIKGLEEVETYVSKRLVELRSIPQASSGEQKPTPLDILGWKKVEGKGFEWIFHTTKEGNEIPETKDLAETIRAAPKEKLVEGEYAYTISKDSKFLQRRRTEK
jgi:hypothetical protein